MRLPIDSKLPQVGTTIFTVMSRLAAEHGAINLSQGFPDFEPPARLLDLADEHMRRRNERSAGNQYAPMTGLPVLRELIATRLRQHHAFSADPEAGITVTAATRSCCSTPRTTPTSRPSRSRVPAPCACPCGPRGSRSTGSAWPMRSRRARACW
jgi:methionine aminotransferase